MKDKASSVSSKVSSRQGNQQGSLSSAIPPFVDSSSIQYVTKKHELRKNKIALENADIYYLQQWFTKISFRKKLKFILEILGTINETPSLKLLLPALKNLTKDLYYSRSHCTKFSYDVVPLDDDRLLDQSTLAEVMENELEWLKSLNIDNRCNILLHLIKMSGSALALKALNETQTLVDIYEFIDILKDKFVPEEIIKSEEVYNVFKQSKISKKSDFTKILSQDISKNPKIIPLINVHKACQAIKPKMSDNPKIQDLLKGVEKQEKLWDVQLRKLLNTIRTGEIDGKDKLKVTRSGLEVDKFQLLPLWINRYILKYLDDNSKKNVSKVDFYWKYAVQEEAIENQVRKELNKVIQKLDVKLLNTKLPGTRFIALQKKTKKPLSADKAIKRNVKKGRKKPQSAEPVDDLKESIYTILKHEPKDKNPFRGSFKQTIISTAYMYDRSIACTRKWVACTENTSVIFYNLITGEKAPFEISGHSLVVTCIAFFPSSFRLATGSLDKTIKTWDIWNRKELNTYLGNTQVILSVSVNEEYLASCAKDSTIRVYSQLSGVTIGIIKHPNWIPTDIQLTTDHLVYWVNRQGSINMFSITDKSIYNTVQIAHKSDITFLAKFDNLIITTGGDHFVRIWNANLDQGKPLAEFYHDITVNSALLSHLTIITACADGCLRFWDIGNCKLFRTITVNMSRIPIIGMCIQNYDNHVKILCNNESNITVIEFKINWRKQSKKTNPFLGIMMHPIKDPRKRKPHVENRLLKLQKRKCTLPVLRFSENYKTSNDCILKKCINEKRLIEIFPRYSKSVTESSDSEITEKPHVHHRIEAEESRKKIIFNYISD